MNYEDILPPNWLQIMRQANNTYLNHITRMNPLLSRIIRMCLDRQNECPMKRLGGCITSHCILRYPHETQLTHFQ